MSGTATAAPVPHLTADELGERFGVDRYAIYELVKAEKIRALHIGRRIMFRLADVEAWEAAGGSPPRPKATKRSKRRRAA